MNKKRRRKTDRFYDRSPVGKRTERIIDQYVQSIRRRGRADCIQSVSATNLRTYFRWLSEHNLRYLDVTAADVDDYREHLSRTYTSTTAFQKTVTLRRFYEYLLGSGKVLANPVTRQPIYCVRCDDGERTELLDAFGEYMAGLNRASTTIEGTRCKLRCFFRYLDMNHVESFDEVTGDDIMAYRNALEDSGEYAQSTVLDRVIAIKQFYDYLIKTGAVKDNPADLLPVEPLERNLPRDFLSRKEADALLEQPDVGTDKGIRDRTMLEVFYSSGLRLAELVHLDVSDIDTSKCEVMVRQGKGAKDRRVPVGNSSVFWVKLYRDTVRPRMIVSPSERAMFVGVYSGKRIHKDVLYDAVVKYAGQAGIDKAVFPHLLRHSFATHLVSNGCSTMHVKEMLGHELLDSTQVYTHATINDLKETHERYHPRN